MTKKGELPEQKRHRKNFERIYTHFKQVTEWTELHSGNAVTLLRWECYACYGVWDSDDVDCCDSVLNVLNFQDFYDELPIISDGFSEANLFMLMSEFDEWELGASTTCNEHPCLWQKH